MPTQTVSSGHTSSGLSATAGNQSIIVLSGGTTISSLVNGGGTEAVAGLDSAST